MSNAPSALALNTATLGHNLEGYGAGWPVERVIDACAARGLGGITFWRREIGTRAIEIGDKVRAAGMEVTGLCRTPYLVGRDAPEDLDDAKATVDMAAALGTKVLTVVTGGTEPNTKGVIESQKLLADRVAELAPYAADRDVCLALEPLNPMHLHNPRRTGDLQRGPSLKPGHRGRRLPRLVGQRSGCQLQGG